MVDHHGLDLIQKKAASLCGPVTCCFLAHCEPEGMDVRVPSTLYRCVMDAVGMHRIRLRPPGVRPKGGLNLLAFVDLTSLGAR
ncbi:hypothetical protein P3T25_005759 [Paraburkholderia sp. GAS32]